MADDTYRAVAQLGVDSEKVYTHAFFPEVNLIEGATISEMRLERDGRWVCVVECDTQGAAYEVLDRFREAGNSVEVHTK